MALVWAKLPDADLTGWYYFPADTTNLVTTTGKIIDVKPTGYSVIRQNIEGRQQLYKISYTYTGAKGQGGENKAFHGVAYSPNQTYAKGAIVTVEYLPQAPGRSRMSGELTKPIGPQAGLILFIPGVCLVIIFASIVTGLKQTRLLANGQIAMASLKHAQPVPVGIHAQPLFRQTFQFLGEDGKRYKTTCMSRVPSTEASVVAILYDPANPAGNSAALDMLPGDAVIHSNGQLADPGMGRYYILIPLITVLVNVIWAGWLLLQP